MGRLSASAIGPDPLVTPAGGEEQSYLPIAALPR